MRYRITVEYDRKKYRYYVDHQVIDQRIEHFKLITKSKTLTIESNRPLFRNKGLKHRRYDMKILEGSEIIWNRSFVESIFEQIHKLVEMFLEKPPDKSKKKDNPKGRESRENWEDF